MLYGQYAAGNSFDPEAITVLADAVDDAWDRLRRCGSECVRPAYARVMREVVARRIIEMAQRGTSDPKKLAEGALRFLATNYRMDPKQTKKDFSARTSCALLG